MIYVKLLIIAFIVVNIIDISGIINHIKHWIWRILKKGSPYRDFELKPFTCSYCMTHWIGLIYLLVTGEFSFLAYLYLLGLCYLTPVMGLLMRLIYDIMIKIINEVYNLFKL